MVKWEEENLTILRKQQLDMIKCLSSSTNPEVKKRWSVLPNEDLLVTFLPSPPGVMDLVGTLIFKQLEDDVPASEATVDQLKVQMEKELHCKGAKNLKRKHEAAAPKTSKQEQEADGDSTGREVELGKLSKEEKTNQLEEEYGVNRPKSSCQKNESLKFQDGTPKEAVRPAWASEGGSCLARSEKTGFWYEAQILRHQPPNLCMVLFVRSGDHAVVGPAGIIKEVKDLQEEQLLDPAMQKEANSMDKEEIKLLKGKTLKQGEEMSAVDQTKASIKGKSGESVEMWELESVCIAKWTEDGVWYRAKVTEVLEGNCYTVCFLDYGNTATITATDMVTSRGKVPGGEIIDEYVPHDREEGSTCLALYKEEMIWCRAKLVEKTNGGWEVEFTDYGGERAEVEDEDLVDSIQEVPQGHSIDSAVLNCGDVEIGKPVVEDEVKIESGGVSDNQKQAEGNGKKELSSEGKDTCIKMASHCNDEEAGEPSMEMETAPAKPMVPMPAPHSSSSPATLKPGNPVLLLQPDDMCLAVWAEDGVCIFCTNNIKEVYSVGC